MSNPTLGAGQQFTAPYDILPNSVYTNPTSQNAQQFTAPYDILPNLVYTNPTSQFSSQFSSFNSPGPNLSSLGLASQLLLNNPTFNNDIQFDSTYASTPGYAGNPFNNIPVTILKTGFSLEPEASAINVISDFTNLTNAQFVRNGFGYASSIAAGALGFPQIGQSAQKIFDTAVGNNDVVNNTYFTLPFDQLTSKINYAGSVIDIVNSVGNLAPYPDFRSKRFASSFANQNASLAVKISSAIGKARKDGAAVALRRGNYSDRSALYAAATLSPAGAYSLFNLNGNGKLGYGWGDHDNPYALRSDFTLRSEVNTRWEIINSTGSFVRSKLALDRITPFRGDKVNVIDFGRRLLKNAYQWLPSPERRLASSENRNNVPDTSLTKDFIKFILTGPTLTANNFKNGTIEDDIIVFRAILTSLSDSFSPSWTDVKMIGRADPNYQYSGYARSVSLGFDVVITDRDEIKPTWRKLNALAGYCAPKYDETSIALVGPWMRMTLGDLFHQTPVVMTSLSYTYDLDHSWEINIEGDDEMFETPRKISVSCDFNVITDTMPQNNGRFFGLAKEYNSENLSIEGDNNWLSDFKPTAPQRRFRQEETRLANAPEVRTDGTNAADLTTNNTGQIPGLS